MKRGTLPFFLVTTVLFPAVAAAQQQGSIQVSSQTQVLEGDPVRRAGERRFEPDFSINWLEPGSTFGQWQMQLSGTRRGDSVHLGRSWLSLRDASYAGLKWTFEAGDIYASPAITDDRFTNLSAPPVTFEGASIGAHSAGMTFQVVGGRSTAWRNIFGSSPDPLDQALGLATLSYKLSPRLQLLGRASHVRTTNLKEFTRRIDASDEAGAGLRYELTPSVHLVADGGWVDYRATGATHDAQDVSYLFGTHVLLSRGWIQANVSRFSPGEFPVLNAPLQDRSGAFAGGEYDLFSRMRVFGGWETIASNLEPAGVSLAIPQSTVDRGYAGVRVRMGDRSTVSVRLDDGGRDAKPLLDGRATISDTGALSADWQSTNGRASTFLRYSKRDNVDLSNASSTFTQHDGSAQLFFNATRRAQLFGIATVTHTASASGAGNTFVQVSGGGAHQMFGPGLWIRLEASGSTNRDLQTGLLSPRESFSVGLTGQLTRNTTIALSVYADRASDGLAGAPSTWLTRSSVRLTHTISTGTARMSNGVVGAGASARTHGSATVLGSVYADWNGNGRMDAGEEQLGGIPVQFSNVLHVTTARDGQFAFMNVPAGSQHVALDLRALPVDFDPPAVPDLVVDLGRGDTQRVAFGLIPLGAVHGRVVNDLNRNGVADAGEPAVEGAVLTLDGGERSEVVRKGIFRFEAVRSGAHRLALLAESLPDGSKITGEAEQSVTIAREHPAPDATFLVTIAKRPEIRKVFPPKRGGGGGRSPASAGAGRGRTPAASTVAAPRRSASGAAVIASATRRPSVNAAAVAYTIQIAALNDPLHARDMVDELKSAGFPAYLVDPLPDDPDGPYRVRVGRYRSPGLARHAVGALEKLTKQQLWVTTYRRR
ncbi:MAG TPA: SPOR domain-containing protein [Vicinamibacterales bacterium]|nr:SPOR domain-containing protein [Vicinamibacterales bacterium]